MGDQLRRALTAGELRKQRHGSDGFQTVVINAPARAMLKSLPRASSWVLPSQHDRQRPLVRDWIEAKWQRIRAVAGLADVHLHDLGHTVGTYAGQFGAKAL